MRSVFADATDAFCAACENRTAGNPFYLHELLRSLRAEHVSSGEIEFAELQGMAPRSVSRSVLVRVARVDTGAGALAQAVAIFGDHAEFRHVVEVAELADDDASRALDALTGADVLQVGEPLAFINDGVVTSGSLVQTQ